MVEYLRLEDTAPLDFDITANDLLTEHEGTTSLATIALSKEDAIALLNVEP